MIRRFPLAAAVIIVGLFAARASAQVAQADLRGTVLDESGGALPAATITATHVDTGTMRTTTTSSAGTYVMPALPVGTYTIKAEMAGFATVVKEGIRLAVGQSAALDFSLKLAAVAETITAIAKPWAKATASSHAFW